MPTTLHWLSPSHAASTWSPCPVKVGAVRSIGSWSLPAYPARNSQEQTLGWGAPSFLGTGGATYLGGR
ncbi:hypothetical protein FJTKL_07307 [Diaporthe vaccinii]|uniref:Uncharacterized protein n=1 Tax=Diaporthe vaccinii TaxID=105482 RepID=A0ABR4EUE9_9PEZI